jgi:hypothetical protein
MESSSCFQAGPNLGTKWIVPPWESWSLLSPCKLVKPHDVWPPLFVVRATSLDKNTYRKEGCVRYIPLHPFEVYSD